MDGHQGLRLFLHLTGTLNFGRTSTECHVSPATLTRTIQRLEAQVGHQLLIRGPRGVALTEQGRHFEAYAREVLQRWENFLAGEEDVSSDLSGRLRIFSSVTASLGILPALLAPFRAKYPRVEFDLHTGDAAAAIARLDEGAVDLAVAALPRRIPEQLMTRVIAQTPLVFVSAHDALEAQQAVRNGQWAATPFVLPRSGLARDAADRWFRHQRVSPSVVGEVDGHEALLSLVMLGCGVGVVPRLVLDQSFVRDRIVVLDVEPALAAFTIGLCVRRGDLRRPAISALWATLDS